MFGTLGISELLILLLFSLVFVVFPFWKIFYKAGFPGWYSVVMLLYPIAIIAIFYLAFKKWPLHKALEDAGIELNIKKR
ncbi:MAG: hypothetical protein IBX60_01220 [Candidatus Aminicenantes bacterium]|nr:hypothetical protein [Candidatus Aminicenantes bacterium]